MRHCYIKHTTEEQSLFAHMKSIINI
jgi:hypothetical protein